MRVNRHTLTMNTNVTFTPDLVRIIRDAQDYAERGARLALDTWTGIGSMPSRADAPASISGLASTVGDAQCRS